MIRTALLACLLACLLAAGLVVSAGAEPPAAGEGPGHVDQRYGLAQRYPDVGSIVADLPPDALVVPFGSDRYWFRAGVWYRGYGAGYAVTSAPPGIVVPVLPTTYVTLKSDAGVYYYANDTYYRYAVAVNGYEVIAPPAGIETLSGIRTQASQSPALGTNTTYVYPNQGQSAAQQADDRYQCHRWAREQTGFDPTQASGGVAPTEAEARRADYSRAMNACLDGRGYSVR